MNTYRQRRLKEMFLSLGVTTLIIVSGAFFTWTGAGKGLLKLQQNIQKREREIEHLRKEFMTSRTLFLEGDEADHIRSQFEQRATPAEYFSDVLGELRSREAEKTLVLHSVSLEQPERASNVTRMRFSIDVETTFPALASLMTYLEEAFPAYQINHFVLSRSAENRSVTGTLSGSLYMPQ